MAAEPDATVVRCAYGLGKCSRRMDGAGRGSDGAIRHLNPVTDLYLPLPACTVEASPSWMPDAAAANTASSAAPNPKSALSRHLSVPGKSPQRREEFIPATPFRGSRRGVAGPADRAQ
jgi:hypothetical protein